MIILYQLIIAASEAHQDVANVIKDYDRQMTDLGGFIEKFRLRGSGNDRNTTTDVGASGIFAVVEGSPIAQGAAGATITGSNVGVSVGAGGLAADTIRYASR